MSLRDDAVDVVVGDRCPADPCASRNGLKTRVYAVVFLPVVAAVALSTLFPPESAPTTVLAVVAFLWFFGGLYVVSNRIDDMEPCDDRVDHYGDGRPPTDPLREDCPRCGSPLRHDEGGWFLGRQRVARCLASDCRFEGVESPVALLARRVRRRLGWST